MTAEEPSSTQNNTPMETAEGPDLAVAPPPAPTAVNGEHSGTADSTVNVGNRAEMLLGGGFADNTDEALSAAQAVFDSVVGTPVLPYVIEVAHYLTNLVIQKECPAKGIKLLESLLNKTHSPGVLSSIHSDIAQLCLAAKILSPALKYLDCDIHAISPDEAMDVRYVLQYFYYGGCIYAGLRQFSRALHFFEMCNTVPSQQTTSAIQVVAYQKMALISILSGQKFRGRLPSHHGHVPSNIPHLCRPYTNLLQIAWEEDSEKFAATLAQMTPFLEKHNNLGLAKQALEQIRRKNIKKFQSTFVSLKLSCLASHLRVPVEDVEARLRRMILDGELSAQICKKDGVVWFTKQNDGLDEVEAINSLQVCLESSMKSYLKIKELNKSLSLDDKLIARVAEYESRKDSAPTSSNWDFPAQGKSKKLLSFLE